MKNEEKESSKSARVWGTDRFARGDGAGKQGMKICSFDTVYENERFELLRVGETIFFLELKGGPKHACPGLKKISRKEAEVLLYEHVLEEIRAGTKVCGMTEKEAAELLEAKIREIS